MIVFDHKIEVRDEPAMLLFDGLFLRQTESYDFDISTITNVGFENIASNFKQQILSSFDNIAFLGKTNFCSPNFHISLRIT